MSASTQQPRVTIFVGAHSDVVQLASVHDSLIGYPELCVRLVLTGEDGAAAATLTGFGIEADECFEPKSCHTDTDRLSGEILNLLDTELATHPPTVAIVSGHSTSAFCVALACHQRDISIAHVGAGVRQTRRGRPARDEVNCVMVDAVAELNFAPHARAEENLRREGVNDSTIVVVGDPADDSLGVLSGRVDQAGPASAELRKLAEGHARWIVATCDPCVHDVERRTAICESLRHLAIRYHDLANIVIPMPIHPRERELLESSLQGFRNVHLVPGLDHVDYVWLASSGGIFITDGDIGRKLAVHRPGAILRQMLAGGAFEPAEAAALADIEQSSIVAGVVAIFEGEALRHARKNARPAPSVERAGSRVAEFVAQYVAATVETP